MEIVESLANYWDSSPMAQNDGILARHFVLAIRGSASGQQIPPLRYGMTDQTRGFRNKNAAAESAPAAALVNPHL